MTLDPKGCAAQEYEEQQLKQESPDWSVVSRTAVLADAEGLLTCYGVGEESTGQLTHAVIELCFTSSVRFLQPGLLLQASFRLPGQARQHKAYSQDTPETSVGCHIEREASDGLDAPLQGMGAGEAVETLSGPEPRKSWQMRKRQERAALKEGLAEWQACTVSYIHEHLNRSDFQNEICTRHAAS